MLSLTFNTIHAPAQVFLYIAPRQGYHIAMTNSPSICFFRNSLHIKSHSVEMISVYELLKGEALYLPHLS